MSTPQRQEKLDIYYIPQNYQDGGGILNGMFKTRNVIEGAATACTVFVLINGIHTANDKITIAKLIIAFVIAGVIGLVGMIGINDEPVSLFLLQMLQFLKARRKLIYKQTHVKMPPRKRNQCSNTRMAAQNGHRHVEEVSRSKEHRPCNKRRTEPHRRSQADNKKTGEKRYEEPPRQRKKYHA